MGRKKALSVNAMFLGINNAQGDVKSQQEGTGENGNT